VIGEDERRSRGIGLHEAGRGGDVTYHGPEQLIGYPILALRGDRRDAHRYLRDLEDGLIATAAAFGVGAARIPGLTGVWVGDAKLAAIGVRIGTGWITSHGFALNVGRDLTGFDAIVPCGIRGKSVTSLGRLLDRDLDLERVAIVAAERMASALRYRSVWEARPLAIAGHAGLSSPPAPGGPP
jgi:lipoyl(octanoyl) transferase